MASIPTPPTPYIPRKYAPTHDALQKAIDNPPTINLTEALNTLGSEVSGNQSIQDLKDAIKDVDTIAMSTEKLLQTTENIFNKVVQGATSPQAKSDLENILFTFYRLHSNYIDIFWDTHGTASKAEAVARDFTSNFIPLLSDNDVPFDEKKKEIDAYRQRLQKDGVEPEKLFQRAVDLKKEMDNFVDSWQKTADKNQLDVDSYPVQKADGEITLLDGILRDLENKVEKLAAVLGITPPLGKGLDILSALATTWTQRKLLKSAKGGVTDAIVDAGQQEVSEITSDVSKKLEQRTQLVTTLGSTQQLHAILIQFKRDINRIAHQFAVFAMIWHAVDNDLQGISNVMQSGNRLVLRAALDSTSKVYKALIVVFVEWEELFKSSSTQLTKRS